MCRGFGADYDAIFAFIFDHFDIDLLFLFMGGMHVLPLITIPFVLFIVLHFCIIVLQ